MIVSSEAIVLNSMKYGDTSTIVSLFTKDYGRLSVLAKGSRRTKSKFGSALQPLSYSLVTLYKKPQKDLHVLSAAEHIEMFNNIQQSYEHLACGLMILESVSQALVENDTNTELFETLKKVLDLLNNAKENPFSLFAAFQIELAHNLGFRLNFDLAGKHGTSAQNVKEFIFSLENGYLVNGREHNGKFNFRFDSVTLGKLYSVQNSPLEKISTVGINVQSRKQIRDFFVNYFSYHLEKHFSYRAYSLLNNTK